MTRRDTANGRAARLNGAGACLTSQVVTGVAGIGAAVSPGAGVATAARSRVGAGEAVTTTFVVVAAGKHGLLATSAEDAEVRMTGPAPLHRRAEDRL